MQKELGTSAENFSASLSQVAINIVTSVASKISCVKKKGVCNFADTFFLFVVANLLL